MTPSPPNSSSERSVRRRYPGARPFSDSAEDRALFFGRAEASEELYLRVLSVRFLVQFAKSGLGKTSLLQASLFPRLRQKHFLPVMIRLNVAEETFTHSVARSIEQACKEEGLEFPKVPTEGLWELLSTTLFWRDDLLLTPVLVFDQFEEIFTLHDAAFRGELASELGALATGIAPKRLSSDQANAPGFAKAPEVKIVVSLREEYVGALHELSAAIPGLFHERLRLAPLKEDEAREAITGPAQLKAEPGEQPYWSPPFDFDPAALDSMIVFLKGTSGVIEPFALQLCCQHAEAVAHDKASANESFVKLTLADFEGAKDFESVLNSFYRNTLNKLPFSMRNRAEELCEHGLLDRDGRRLTLEEGQIHRDYGLEAETLDILAQERLVRREPRLESVFYEISHDQLANSICESRGDKLPRKTRRQLWFAGITALVIVFFLLGLTLFINDQLQTADREREKAEALLSFLLGERFLGEVRDIGRSPMLEMVRRQTEQHLGTADQSAPLNSGIGLRNSGDIQRTKGTLKDAAALFDRALTFIESSPDSPDKRREAARTRERLVDVLTDQGKLDQALSNSQAAVEAWRQLVRRAPPMETDATDDCISLALSLVSAGDLKTRMGEANLALKDLNEAVQIASAVLFGRRTLLEQCGAAADRVEPYPDARVLKVFSQAAMSKTSILYLQDDFDGATAFAQEVKRLRPSSTSARTQALLALMVSAFGKLFDTPGRAFDDFKKALREFDELQHWDPDNRSWQHDRAMAQVLVSKGIAECASNKAAAAKSESKDCNSMPSLEEAETTLLDAGAKLRALAQSDPSNLSWQTDLALALNERARVLAALGREPERLKLLEESERIYKRLELDSEYAERMESVALVLQEKAEALSALGRHEEAKKSTQDAVERFTKLITAHKDMEAYVGRLSVAHRREAEILRKAGDETGADVADSKEKQLHDEYNTLMAKRGEKDHEFYEQYARHIADGAKLSKAGDYDAALRELSAAESGAREYGSLRPGNWANYSWLSLIYYSIGEALQNLPNAKERTSERIVALSASVHAARIATLLAPEDKEKEMTKNLVTARRALGKLLLENGRKEEALAMVREEIVAADRLVQKDGQDAFSLWVLGGAKLGLALVQQARKEIGWEEAIRSGLINLQKAAEIDKENSEYLVTVGNARATLADALEKDGGENDALEERRLALNAYREAASRASGDEKKTKEINDKIRKLAEQGVR
jgi:tetratricopeptide (TPR) repeat protein